MAREVQRRVLTDPADVIRIAMSRQLAKRQPPSRTE